MASRTPGPKTKGQIGDMKVEETKMKPNVPNQELGDDMEPIITPHPGLSLDDDMEPVHPEQRRKSRKPKKVTPY